MSASAFRNPRQGEHGVIFSEALVLRALSLNLLMPANHERSTALSLAAFRPGLARDSRLMANPLWPRVGFMGFYVRGCGVYWTLKLFEEAHSIYVFNSAFFSCSSEFFSSGFFFVVPKSSVVDDDTFGSSSGAALLGQGSPRAPGLSSYKASCPRISHVSVDGSTPICSHKSNEVTAHLSNEVTGKVFVEVTNEGTHEGVCRRGVVLKDSEVGLSHL